MPQTARLRSSEGERRVPNILHLQAVQRRADNPGRFGLAGQLKGQHVFLSLDVTGSRLDGVPIPARMANKERKKEKERGIKADGFN